MLRVLQPQKRGSRPKTTKRAAAAAASGIVEQRSRAAAEHQSGLKTTTYHHYLLGARQPVLNQAYCPRRDRRVTCNLLPIAAMRRQRLSADLRPARRRSRCDATLLRC